MMNLLRKSAGIGVLAVVGVTLILPGTVDAVTAFNPANQPTGYVAQLEITNFDLTSGNERVFRTEYEKQSWSGGLYSNPVSSTGIVDTSSPSWSGGAQFQIDTQDFNSGRLIATMKDNGTVQPFRWANLSATQQGYLNSDSTLLDFLRGDRSKEISNSGSFRDRNHVLGDIVHSRPFYVADVSNPTIFVGSNDGMLHAINATTDDTVGGTERWAYVPSMLLSKMKNLSANPYVHDYYVDGQINIGTISISGVSTRVLVGGLGAGGRGLYALNINSLTATTEAGVASKVLWEISPTTVNYAAPATTNAYTNLGYTYGTPLITKVLNGATKQDAVIIGNGYNDATGTNHDNQAYLFVINAANGQLIQAIKAGTSGTSASPNGLSSPTAISGGVTRIDVTSGGSGYTSAPAVSFSGGGGSGTTATATISGGKVTAITITNAGTGYTSMPFVFLTGGSGTGAQAAAISEGVASIVYAGDLNGILWKFNLSSTNPASWTATALLATSPLQPITSNPTVAVHPNGGHMINFATGAVFTAADLTDPTAYYAYGVWDGAPGTNTTLLTQTITERSYPPFRVRDVTSNMPDWTTGHNNGWKVPLSAGERVVGEGCFVQNGRFYFNSYNPTQSLLITSVTPSFTIYGEDWLMELDYLNGGVRTNVNQPFLDLNGDGKLDDLDRIQYIASDTIPSGSAVGDPILTSPGIAVGKFLANGVQSQPLLVRLTTLNDTLFNQNPDVTFPPALTSRGIAGGHFDVDIYIYNGPTSAAATAVLAPTSVGNLTLTNGGSNYTSAPSVSITGGGGSGATATTTLAAGPVNSLTLTAGGSGYSSAPSVSITGGGGSGATATTTLANAAVGSLSLTAGGSSYTSAPSVAFSGGGGSGATATTTLTTAAVSSLSLTAGGSNYTSAPSVLFSGGGGSGATATTTLGSSPVTSLSLTAGGSGYTSAPSVSFSGGGGSGATATTTLGNGPVASLNLTAGGSGYTSAPSVSFSGGGGSGATATTTLATAAVSSLSLTAGGSGYTSAPSVSFSGGGGSGATATTTLASAAVSSLSLTAGGSGYTSAPSVSFSGGGGSGAAATTTLAATGSVTSVTVTGQGSGYTSTPTVGFTGCGGSGATATATRSSGKITAVTVTSGGSGYTCAPTVTFSGATFTTSATATSTLSFAVASINLTAGGSGYTSAPTLSFSGGGGSGAAATSTLATRAVASINLTAGGSGYMSAPTLSFSGGGGSGAAATSTLATSAVASINLTAGGSGYTSAPTLSFSGGGGSGAAATAAITRNVSSINLTSGGSGYTSAPTLSFSGGGGSGAAATASVSLPVATINLTSGGSGYTSAPTLSFSGGGGSGAAATATLATRSVATINLTAGGSGYSSAPTLTLSGGGGSGATATATLATRAVASINLTAGGSGYTSVPTVTLSGGGGSGATATAAVTRAVGSITLTAGGSGYTSVPSVSFSGGGGSGAVATATLSPRSVASINVTNQGNRYTSTGPAVTISGGGGSGATAVANITSGKVTTVTVTAGGSGYTSVPTVTFSGGGVGGGGSGLGGSCGGGSTGSPDYGYDCRQHFHEYDKIYNVNGVNFLNPSSSTMRLSNALNTTIPYKVLMMNQSLNRSMQVSIGSSGVWQSVQTYETAAGLTMASLPTFTGNSVTTGTITNLQVEMPQNAFSAQNWWSDGVVQAGVMPTSPSCVYATVSNGTEPANSGIFQYTGPNGERNDGSWTIQLVRDTTPDSAVQLNVAGHPELGYRVKDANFADYVLAEYTLYWHHPNRICYGNTTEAWYNGSNGSTSPGYPTSASSGAWNTAANMNGTGWSLSPPLDTTPDNPAIWQTPLAGSADPSGFSFRTTGTLISTSTTKSGNVTTTTYNYSDGSKTVVTSTVNTNHTITIATTNYNSNGTVANTSSVTVIDPSGTSTTGGDERGLQARTGRISWHELIR